MSNANLKEDLRALVAEIAEKDEIPDGATFKELGIDSMMGVEIVAADRAAVPDQDRGRRARGLQGSRRRLRARREEARGEDRDGRPPNKTSTAQAFSHDCVDLRHHVHRVGREARRAPRPRGGRSSSRSRAPRAATCASSRARSRSRGARGPARRGSRATSASSAVHTWNSAMTSSPRPAVLARAERERTGVEPEADRHLEGELVLRHAGRAARPGLARPNA